MIVCDKYIFDRFVHFGFAGNNQEVMLPPVEGVAGGGTSYGWSDAGIYASGSMKGTIDPSEVPSSELLHVWCMPSTANVGSQEMPRHLEPVCMLYLFASACTQFFFLFLVMICFLESKAT